jgi:hypothetical protein
MNFFNLIKNHQKKKTDRLSFAFVLLRTKQDRKRRMASGCFIIGMTCITFSFIFPSNFHTKAFVWLASALFLATPFLLRYFTIETVSWIAGGEVVLCEFVLLCAHGSYNDIRTCLRLPLPCQRRIQTPYVLDLLFSQDCVGLQ